MANIRDTKETLEINRRVLVAATKLFIEKGYERASVTDIAKLSGVPQTKIFYVMKTKEDILTALVTKFLDGVTSASDSVSKKLTENKLFIYAANEVLQIYMAEMNEDMRNLYLSGYSLQKTGEVVLMRRTEMMYSVFGEYLPHYEKKDFYETEIASMGILRSYMMVPCDMYFTKAAKAELLITMLLRIYELDREMIKETIEFIKQIDFAAVAEKVIADLFKELDI